MLDVFYSTELDHVLLLLILRLLLQASENEVNLSTLTDMELGSEEAILLRLYAGHSIVSKEVSSAHCWARRPGAW